MAPGVTFSPTVLTTAFFFFIVCCLQRTIKSTSHQYHCLKVQILWSQCRVLSLKSTVIPRTAPSLSYIYTTIVFPLFTKSTLFFKSDQKKRKNKWVALVFVLAASVFVREEVVQKQSSKLVGIIQRLLRNLFIPCALSVAWQ